MQVLQEILHIAALSIGSVITLFILTKIMGYRQMSQLSMFDYINGITIGSIAAEMATSLEDSFVQPLSAMIIYSLSAFLLSYTTMKSIKARRIISGKPLILLSAGTIFEKNLKKAKIDISEFLLQCRVNGYFDVSKLELAVLEENGRMSFLPKASERPVNPADLNLTPEQDFLVANVIIDGKVMIKNLKHSGKDEIWLDKQLKSYGVTKVSDVLLATCDRNNKLTVFPKTKESMNKDVLA